MGCKQSKAVRVQPVGAAEMRKSNELAIEDRTKKHSKRSKSNNTLGSRGSLDGDSLGSDDRQGSAGSKKSNDSGLDLGEENHGFITEYSDPDKRRTIEDGFQERDDLDLGVTGTQLPTRNSAKDKARMEESMVMQKLREEGLISKTTAEKKGGVSFDIVDMKMPSNANKLPALPPLKLAKLEKRRKKKVNLTEEEIEEKLRRAEARRKRKEQARLEKIKDMDKADQAAALSSFADYQKKKEEQSVQKMESVADKRERLLQERREKQLEREKRREEVRRRKAERKALGITETENGEIINDASELMDRQSTPQVPE